MRASVRPRAARCSVLAVVSCASCLIGACSSGGGDSISGTATLAFSPQVAVWTASAGSCPVCGSIIEPTDGGPAPPGSPSGPAPYHATSITLSDDPGLQTACAAGGAAKYAFDAKQFHYATILAVDTAAIAPGDFPLVGKANLTGPSALFVVTGPGSGSFGYTWDDSPKSGTVTLTSVGASVSGSFTAAGLYNMGSKAAGDVSGSFDATACPNLGETPIGLDVCGACPG